MATLQLVGAVWRLAEVIFLHKSGSNLSPCANVCSRTRVTAEGIDCVVHWAITLYWILQDAPAGAGWMTTKRHFHLSRPEPVINPAKFEPSAPVLSYTPGWTRLDNQGSDLDLTSWSCATPTPPLLWINVWQGGPTFIWRWTNAFRRRYDFFIAQHVRQECVILAS